MAVTNPRQPYTANSASTITAPINPKLLANHGKDKVRMRLGQKEKLLAAFHQANARKSAGANGDQRLQQLKSVALRIRTRRKEGLHALQPVRHADDQEINYRQTGEHASGDVAQGEARDIKHHERYQRDHARGAQIRFGNHQSHNQQEGSQNGRQGAKRVVHPHAARRGAIG